MVIICLINSNLALVVCTQLKLLRFLNDLLLQGDAGECSVLVLLDLSTAFDTVDHCILVERLIREVGIFGTALSWFSSYLSDRSFSVRVQNYTSSTAPVSCGVLQGSVLAPLLFALYLLPLGQLNNFEGIHYHCYADDIQLYIYFKSHEITNLSTLLNCINSIKVWMANNYLQLNPEKKYLSRLLLVFSQK